MQAREMISSHPAVRGNINYALVNCIEECLACAQACTACADACLGEDKPAALRQCIRLNLDCADICIAAATLASRRTGSNDRLLRRMIELCAAACALCAEECRRHQSIHEHCRICAEACASCQESCEGAARSLG